MGKDRITLTVPAKSEYAKAVRMTAAALVSRLGMTFDEVDDVRMAAEEAFVYAVDSQPEGSEVAFSFLVGDDALEIEVCLGAEAATGEEVEARTSYATFILQGVCDSYEFVSDEAGMPKLRLVKRVGSVDAD